MEKKKYAEPETEIIVFQTLDVMCASKPEPGPDEGEYLGG